MKNIFHKQSLVISRGKKRLLAVLVFIGFLFIKITMEQYPVPDIFFSLLNHIFFIEFVLLFFQADIEKKILAASMLITVKTLTENFCVSFFSCLVLFWMHTVKNIPVPFLDNREFLLIYCISLLIELLIIYWMSRHLISVFYGKTRKWYILLAIPLLTITTVIDVANWGASKGILVRSGGNMGLYYDQIFSHTGLCILTALSMFATGFYVFGMDRIYLEQEKNVRYHSQIAAYKMLEEQYTRSERLRHDMKNHIIALSGLLENQEWEKMGDYLENMKDSGFGSCENITGNKVVDALLYQKQNIAESENILWECDVQIPKICSINEFDLCVLFGNILDNAIEACVRIECKESQRIPYRFIDIQAKVVKRCFLVEVKNSANIEKNFDTGFPKKSPKGHGIGLLNIRDIVQKYNGVTNIEMQNDTFIISLLIPLQNAAHDIKQTI